MAICGKYYIQILEDVELNGNVLHFRLQGNIFQSRRFFQKSGACHLPSKIFKIKQRNASQVNSYLEANLKISLLKYILIILIRFYKIIRRPIRWKTYLEIFFISGWHLVKYFGCQNDELTTMVKQIQAKRMQPSDPTIH